MAWWTRADEIYDRRRRAVKPRKPVINKGVQHRQLYKYYLNLSEKFSLDPETLDYESIIDVTEHYDTNKRSVKALFEDIAVTDITEQVEKLEGWEAMMEGEKTEVLRGRVSELWRELDDLEAEAGEETEASMQVAPVEIDIPLVGPPAEEVLSVGDKITHVRSGKSGVVADIQGEEAQVEWKTGGLAWLQISGLRPKGEEERLVGKEIVTDIVEVPSEDIENVILGIIRRLEEEFGLAKREEVMSKAEEEGIYPYMTNNVLEKLKRDGNIYEPKKDSYKVV